MAERGRLKSFKKLVTDDKHSTQVQNNIEQVLTPILRSPIIDGVLMTELCLTAGVSNEVKHKLGRKPLGWIVVRKRKDSRIWDLQDTNPQPTNTLSIACSHDCVVDLWIF